ncbi:hypothetical protein CBF34_06525 [Vagococcus penaei]|uniref:non-specific serine/threonine protein kinase n=1 Tax=Vagococcus penaei TaxID=633807 RepID=A0A1Q2D6V8_9ENTE|nr:Stk1 family PASTA domain-containing Ser/Thr kinase [Vagococcus penaei]AQP54062.1 hypothetical protein BW732_07420 [Vagococcus penaei]RSU01705.1 hypothetical protein CBF34_06525 [Vagococcus penaei]
MISIGQKIGERYEIIGNIGSGGMANVYLARDLILNREVAIKVLRFDFQNDQDAIRRFQREALAATEMVHQNIVGVYDVGEENGMQYIVMEYVEGTDLKQYIKHNSPISLPVVVNIMEQILAAISVAHQHQIIHRDLKPQNILIAKDGTVKITDFGIAIALSETSITQTNTLLGSVHYLSPEQARGGMATRQSDIYALGIILYELLTGVVPFEGESAVSIALKHFQNDIPSVIRFNPNIPQPLENVVLHATAKEIADRYQTVNEMYEDIRTSLDPSRADEPVFKPSVMTDDTIMLTPITEPVPTEVPPVPNKNSDDSNTSLNADDTTSDPKKQSKKRKVKPMFLVLAAIFILVSGGLYVFGRSGQEIAVPDVTGKTEAEAVAILEKEKLRVNPTVQKISDDSVKKGTVVRTNPVSGSKVKAKAEVTLYISSGDKEITMSDFSSMDVDDVKNQLLNEGFLEGNIQTKEEFSDSISTNRVIKQTPKSGKKVVPSETKVVLTVSKGPKTFKLENMYNYSSNRARSYIDSVGLELIEELTEYSDTVPAGQVIYTVPSSGTEMQKGDQITIVYSAGKKPTTAPSTTPSSTQSSSDTSGESKPTTETTNDHGGEKPDNSKDDDRDNDQNSGNQNDKNQ